MAYKWVQSSAYSSLPTDAVVGGNDEDGAMIYVGRAEHECDMLVCKVVPSKQIGFISSRGEALPKDVFELLCGQNLAWVNCYDHIIPDTAVLCGRTSLDQPVYIGRGHYEGHLIIGKISSVHRALFIAYRGAERRLDSYEILVEERRSIPGWQLPPPDDQLEKCPLTPPPPPPPPPSAPIEKLEKPFRYPELNAMPFPNRDPPPSYSPMPMPQQQPVMTPVLAPPPMYSQMPKLVLPVAPSMVPPPPPISPAFMAPASSYTPASVSSYTPAEYGPSSTSSFTPADTYKPSLDPYPAPGCSFKPAEYAPYGVPAPPSQPWPPTHSDHGHHDIWMPASAGYTPPDAVFAGHDTDMAPLLVSRAWFEGSQIPGKAVPSRGCAYIAHAGREIVESSYEVLIGMGKYHWVPGHNGSLAPGAVLAGRSRNGEPFYVGRAHYCGSLTPGKIHPSHGALYIPFGGAERRITSYEVLVCSELFYRQQSISLTY